MVGSIVNTTNTNASSVATGAVALATNPARLGWAIQNQGTNILYVNLGANGSTAAFHFSLKGGSADNDGLGASLSQMSGVVYTGPISVAGTTPKYTVLELAP